MGRYAEGNISHKFWVGIQPSDASSRYGGQEQEPNYISYCYEGVSYSRTPKDEDQFDAYQLFADLKMFFKLLVKLDNFVNSDKYNDFISTIKEVDNSIYKDLPKLIKDHLQSYLKRTSKGAMPAKWTNSVFDLNLRENTPVGMFNLKDEATVEGLIQVMCDIDYALSRVCSYLQHLRVNDKKSYTKFRKVLPKYTFYFFKTYDTKPVSSKSPYTYARTMADIALGLRIFVVVYKYGYCSFDAEL